MRQADLKSFLSELIEDAIRRQSGGAHNSFGVAEDQPRTSKKLAERMAESLISEAVTSGMPLSFSHIDHRALGGGNTAEVVALLTLHAPFAFKLDQEEKKLAAEADMMRNIRKNTSLPREFRDAWPQIYAIRSTPPYAYLMEYFPPEEGWNSLEDRLYPKQKGEVALTTDAIRLIVTAMDVLFSGYEASVKTRSRPNLFEDYVGRIKGRLKDATELDIRFRSQPLVINGVQFSGWEEYLKIIEENKAFVNEITPPFETVAHGDPNPGNLIFRIASSRTELKMIDPKDWQTGDYLFDITKLTHFLDTTGPVEKPIFGAPVEPLFRQESAHADITYAFTKADWTQLLIDICRDRVRQFAERNNDPHWQARYELGMAANLLGLPAGRLKGKNSRPNAALTLYCEGMRWLSQFCSRLASEGERNQSYIETASISVVEPDNFKNIRARIKTLVPSVSEASDRRGFKLLHWDPIRSNHQGKPVELSLEHEARLSPRSDQGLRRLQNELLKSEGLPLSLENPSIGTLIVRRYHRESGAQSIDRYYDLKNVEANDLLIPRMLSLRERIKTSGFMTWSSGEAGMRPLNLELPMISIGNSGVVSRLEFNWIDELKLSVEDLGKASVSEADVQWNPISLANQLEYIKTADIEQVLEHTTYREKYGLYRPANATGQEIEAFQLNIDHVVAQSHRTSRIGTYTDIDISPCLTVDQNVLTALIALTNTLSRQFELVPVAATKAWRDASVTGELRDLN